MMVVMKSGEEHDQCDGGGNALVNRANISKLSLQEMQDEENENDYAEHTNADLARVFVNASMIIIFLLYQTILTQCIATLNCVTITRTPIQGDVEKVLSADVRVACTGFYYEIHVAIATYGVFIYAVLLPLVTMSLVLRQSRVEGWAGTYQQFSFLIKGFRLKYWYWEFVVVFRKTIIRLFIATVEDATLQALLGIWFLTALFVAQTFAKPYVLSSHNRAEQLSLMAALITLNIGLAFKSTGSTCGVICGGFSIFLVVMNVAVLVFFLVRLGFAGYEMLIEMFGLDDDHGERRMSVRNLKNHLLTLMKKIEHTSPSFKTYTPKFIDARLAQSVLGFSTTVDDDGNPSETRRAKKTANEVSESFHDENLGLAEGETKFEAPTVVRQDFPFTKSGGTLPVPPEQEDPSCFLAPSALPSPTSNNNVPTRRRRHRRALADASAASSTNQEMIDLDLI